MKTGKVWLLLAVVVLVGLPGALYADGEDEDKPVPLSMKIYGVGALTNGRVGFPSSFPAVQKPKNLVREHARHEHEEVYLVGQVDELIELVKSYVDPAFWEMTEGADIRSMGESALVIRASAKVHLAVARYLAGLERSYLRTVAVDVQAVKLSAAELSALLGTGSGQQLDAEKVQALLASEARGPAAQLVLENRARGEVFGGAQRAYLRHHEAVRHPEAHVTVPVAGVANPGFAVSVEPVIHADGRSVRLRLDVSLSGKAWRPALRTAKNETIELPAPPTLDVTTDVIVTPGVWSLAHAVTGGWSVLVRAVPGAALGTSRTATALAVGATLKRTEESMEARYFDVASLNECIESEFGDGSYLYDTSFDGPPDVEIPEPGPIFPYETLVELVRECVGPYEIWEDPAAIEARNGILIVRNTKKVLATVETMLETLRRARPVVFSTRVDLVAVDASLRRELLRTPQRKGFAWLLDDEGAARLKKATDAGAAEQLGSGVLTSISGVRNVLRSGRRVQYLSSYKAVRRGASGVVIEPVTATAPAGLELDLRATLTPGGRAAHLEARCMHTKLVEPVRKLATTHGEIELPELDTLRTRTTASVPLDRTAVTAVIPHRGREVLVLMTPRRQAHDK